MRKINLVVLTFIVFDILTGLANGYFKNELNSKKMREGGKNKIGELFALVFANICDKALPYINISIGFNVVDIIGSYLIFMECLSNIENICSLYPKAIPTKVKNKFKQLKSEVEKEWY